MRWNQAGNFRSRLVRLHTSDFRSQVEIMLKAHRWPISTFTLPTLSRRSISTMPALTVESLNPQIAKVQYAVRGELAIKSEEYRVKLKHGESLPFDKVISSNIGNPQQKGLDQPPITFTRQVAALMEWPELAKLAPDVFPKDVLARAAELREEIGSVGAYSHSQGVLFIREKVAEFIESKLIHPLTHMQTDLTF